MIDQSIEHPATRELRGLALYEEHSESIKFEDGVWLIPSQHVATSVYEVRLGRRERCECADFENRHQTCKHVYAATVARSKTRRCVGCKKRFPHPEMVEVHQDQESLTFSEGESLCRGCAVAHGVL